MAFFRRGTKKSQSSPADRSNPSASFAKEALPHMDVVFRFALRLCQGQESNAEDIVQETFLRAWASWHTYEPGTQCRSWLLTICRNEFLRKKGQEKKKHEILTGDVDSDMESRSASAVFRALVSEDPEKEFFDSFVDGKVMAAMDRIAEPFREALVLSDLEGMGYPEISTILDVPVGTVKSRIFRGRRLLQESLYEYALEMGYIRREQRERTGDGLLRSGHREALGISE
ncbi:MAG: sigma-70 family RNA polymerase sigma factor [Gemmatimonadota bacterium]|jgi:RNA polymerase sigma-70 factor (ECF subfamily)|nr:sigma-70 family RNA polymerase sigma factor [Gemmatimonadota bacterium]